MSDLIDRQAAIDGINKLMEIHFDRRVVLKKARNVVEQLPPAQPETTTVTIGRTKGSVTMWYECGACGEPIDQNDCYCRKCGRKLKHE